MDDQNQNPNVQPVQDPEPESNPLTESQQPVSQPNIIQSPLTSPPEVQSSNSPTVVGGVSPETPKAAVSTVFGDKGDLVAKSPKNKKRKLLVVMLCALVIILGGAAGT